MTKKQLIKRLSDIGIKITGISNHAGFKRQYLYFLLDIDVKLAAKHIDKALASIQEEIKKLRNDLPK